MIKNHLWVIPFCVLSLSQSTYAQDMANTETEEFPLHLKEATTAQRDVIFSSVDSLKRLSYADAVHTAEDSVIFHRMRKIQRTVPLAFNEKIKSYIDKYISRNYHPYMCKLQGLADYYFPIYESILAESNLPDEIKYISVVESSLDPHLVSRSGAVGLWQFMYSTAKVYDLTIDGYVDERKDPYAACYAASRYFKEAYDEFNDWLLALASYNCGRGAVRRAIQRSGLERPDFWQLSPYLPQETQNYIPKFIAMTYALKHAREYGIESAPTAFSWAAKPVMVENNVDLDQVAKAVDLPVETVRMFNPWFKRSVVAASADKPKRLIIPETTTLNDSLLYAALNNALNATPQLALAERTGPAERKYLVRKGETLSAVSQKFGVSVQDLKAWNSLSSNSLIAGRTLIVQKEESSTLAGAPVRQDKDRSRLAAVTYTTYTVRKGDTLSGIAMKFKGSTVTKIKADNNLQGSALQIGQRLKIRKS
ncbi:membrane-bound lytic murein transglycosylase D [Sphingobacterium allocomposti]|uniref:Membrane-bound lytic murein transglycosylase D n=1 Tax=Sphingobacterium allocomposti TaxID=415956 RepID=A0A5S5DKB9_9SPHI|nr:LysM peptidoglycan-binding domain-containing protein [Sphingobacterium composti Yoo et al. 2007 non Ten et al. 2007]TYP96403.1 membrane-bound lytic murein transglycosylase D [Sphingobacterium composti Yoo et al. 2007 non Ten et al. 2007]